MKTLSFYSLLLTLFCVAFSTSLAQAQTEKITVRILPKPGQTTQFKMTQEMAMEVTFEGDVPPQLAAMNPMKMTMNSAMALTQKSATPDKQGRLAVELTYDQATSEMTMNGQSVPLDAANKMVGQTIKMVYDQQGNLLDVTAPAETPLPKEALQEFLKSIFGYLPTEPMAVGETVSVPFKQPLPLPLPGAGPLNLDGTMQIKLAAMNKEGTDRIAKLEQIADAKMVTTVEVPNAEGQQAKMTMDFKMSGGGSSTINLDKGLLKGFDTLMRMEGKMTMPEAGGSAGAKMPNILLKGTIKITVAGS